MDHNSKQTLELMQNLSNENPKSCEEPPKQLQIAIAKIKERYGSPDNFINTFNKHIQPLTASFPERAYLGTAPTLSLIRQAYSREVLIVWLVAQLEDVNDFIGVKHKMSVSQMEHVAQIIAIEYHYLKASEIHLFLFRLKAGRYGLFYGVIDPMKITQSINLFNQERILEIGLINEKRKQREQEALRQTWFETRITREQYDKLKNK